MTFQPSFTERDRLAAAHRQASLNKLTRPFSAILGLAALVAVLVGATDLAQLLPASLAALTTFLATAHPVASFAIGLIAGLLFILAERFLVRRSADAWSNFIQTPIGKRHAWRIAKHTSLPFTPILLLLLGVVPYLLLRSGLSVGAFFAGVLLTLASVQTEMSRLTTRILQIRQPGADGVPPNPSLQRTPPG